MKPKQFEILCKSCDKVLYKSLKPERIANNWLNVIRPHPIFTAKYNFLFDTRHSSFQNLKKLIKYILSIIYHLVSSFFFFFKKKQKIPKKYDSIFLSHLVKEDFLNNENDFYFHNFCPSLFNNKKSLFIYINNTNNNFKDNIYSVSEKIDKIIFRKYLSPLEEIKIIFKLLKDALSIISIKSETKFDKRVKLSSSIEAISPSTISNMRIGLQTSKIVKSIKPYYLFTLFEGFSWERLVFYYSEKAYSKIKTIGYQHVFVFNNHHSLTRSFGQLFSPNYILSSSRRNKQIFIENNIFLNEEIFVVGTKRSSKSYLFDEDTFNKASILFLPEGDIEESIKFIDFSIKSALENPLVKFIIRFHPVVEKEIINYLNTKFNQKPTNWIYSNEIFEVDLKRSSFAFYRGSSTIIKAIKYGLMPIFYKLDENTMIDPLYDLEKYKYSITSSDQLTEILKINKIKFFKNIEMLNKNIDYFLSPIDENELSRFEKKVLN